MSQRNPRIVRYRKPIKMNVGILVFLIIFIYIAIISIQYLNKDHISIYEVSEKSIADDNTYQGLILRDETLFYTKKAGYINYFISEGQKVGKNTTVYTVDESGKIFELLSENDKDNTLSKDDSTRIRRDISSFKKSYNNSNFGSEISNFSYSLASTTLDLTNMNMLSNLESYKKSNHDTSSFEIVKSSKSGVVSYFIDGLESTTIHDIKKSLFKKNQSNPTQVQANVPVKRNSPVYKLVTSDNWTIILSLSEKQYKKLKEKTNIKISFPKNNISTTASLSVFKKAGEYYARLDLNKYLIHFINQRFVEVELSINAAEGLKIPVTSLLKKKFFTVPLEYFTVNGASNRTGLITETYNKKGEKEFTFVAADIYYQDEKYGYVDTLIFSVGDRVVNEKKPTENESYELSKTKELEGVYNVNKGYCSFRRIEKIYENEEYCIVKDNTTFGLAVYDHIVVNSDTIEEQDIIY